MLCRPAGRRAAAAGAVSGARSVDRERVQRDGAVSRVHARPQRAARAVSAGQPSGRGQSPGPGWAHWCAAPGTDMPDAAQHCTVHASTGTCRPPNCCSTAAPTSRAQRRRFDSKLTAHRLKTADGESCCVWAYERGAMLRALAGTHAQRTRRHPGPAAARGSKPVRSPARRGSLRGHHIGIGGCARVRALVTQRHRCSGARPRAAVAHGQDPLHHQGEV